MPRFVTGVAVIAFLVTLAPAQDRPFYRQSMPLSPGSGGLVALPYVFDDANGNIWRINGNGWVQEDGNAPVINQGALLYVNGNASNQQNNQAHLDARTGELVVENMEVGGIDITRRLLFHKRESALRYIDIFHNSQNQAQSVTVSITTNMNFGVASSQFITDPTAKDHNLAWIGQTAGGRAVAQVYGGSAGKVAPTLDVPQNGNTINATYVLNIPAGRDVAILHLHALVATSDAGVRFVSAMKQPALMTGVALPLRKTIVNFPEAQEWIDDVEILRGDSTDIIELRNGDRLRGTFLDTAISLQTRLGPIDLPMDNINSIVNTGEMRTRQLIIAANGEIFGGRLKKQTLDMRLQDGQLAHIPLVQMNRAGFHKRSGEEAGWVFDKPLLLLRGGERMMIQPLSEPLKIATRYGALSIKPETIAAISFQNEENALQDFTLTDGSRFAGLLTEDHFDFTLATSGQKVRMSAGEILRLQFTARMPDVDDRAPVIRLANDDLFVGKLLGKINLDTDFDALPLGADDIRLLTSGKPRPGDSQALLWDGTLISGRLSEMPLTFQTKTGIALKLPSQFLIEYSQPPAKDPGSSKQKE